jgi:hypothetical protein
VCVPSRHVHVGIGTFLGTSSFINNCKTGKMFPIEYTFFPHVCFITLHIPLVLDVADI